jgi:glyoxylase-like metal-dependent hydrolase (beta-lactamase superfamily II)
MLQQDVVKAVHRIEDAYTNWYIVEEDGRLTVVDAGVPSSWTSFLSALGEIGAKTSDVDALILTHAHFDHLGFAERARTDLGVPVWVHENDVPLTKQPRQYAHERSRIPYLFKAKAFPSMTSLVRHRAFWPPAVREVTRFTEGVLPVPGSPKVIFTPGHTLGHCAFLLEDRDTLIAGDCIVTLDPYTGLTGPRLVARAATADTERALASLDAIRATGAGTVLTGHGEPWTDGVAKAVDAARRSGVA